MSNQKPAAMLDTNIFNRLLDGKISASDFDQYLLFATHIQYDELRNTPQDKSGRRQMLLEKFSESGAAQVETTVVVAGYSRVGQCRLGDGVIYNRALASLKEKQSNPDRKSESNIRDAIIVDTTVTRKMILVTADRDLAAVASELGAKVHPY